MDASSSTFVHHRGGVLWSHGLVIQRGKRCKLLAMRNASSTLHGWAQFHHKTQGHYRTKTRFF
jgi:hypothetical protein